MCTAYFKLVPNTIITSKWKFSDRKVCVKNNVSLVVVMGVVREELI